MDAATRKLGNNQSHTDSIGERFRYLRTYLDLTVCQFSSELGVPAISITSIEQKIFDPHPKILASLATKYPQYAYWLLTGDSNSSPKQASPTNS